MIKMDIEKVMTKGIIVCRINNDIKKIANIMKKYDVGFYLLSIIIRL